MNGTITLGGSTSAQMQGGYGQGYVGNAMGIHAQNNLSGGIIAIPNKQDAMLAFAAAAFTGVYASDLSLVLTDEEKVAKAWDFAEKLLAEGIRRGHNFY